MSTGIKEREKVKSRILNFTIKSVEIFLKENSNQEFYAFAFDCNAEYAELGLCFNTETYFQETLKDYQKGKFAEYYKTEVSKHYKTEEGIKSLRYNTGDWEYQCFDTLSVFSNDELDKIFNELPDDDESWNNFVFDLLDLFTESLVEFTKTETYAKIPKTKDFMSFCIDHDEDFDDAIKRMKKYS